MEALKHSLDAVGQEHLLKFHAQLEPEQAQQLMDELSEIDWYSLREIYQKEVLPQIDHSGSSLKPVAKIDDKSLSELPDYCIFGTGKCNQREMDCFQSVGLDHIKSGKVAALLLAGGQGTRLGSDAPKGMYDVGLPGNKSLFQLQAERLIKLKALAGGARILWYIMTSKATTCSTKEFFQSKNFFGLKRDEIIFFEQGRMPCFGFDGKILMDEKFRLSRSPNGNGGLYEALHEHKIIDHMRNNGVQFVHVYCVDNILVRICDPTFIGCCISRNSEAGAKVVEKRSPYEAVGIICKVQDKFKVIEYSEISDKVASKLDEKTGGLAFNAGNICDHFFSVDFLDTIKGESRRLKYHLAIKKVPHIDLNTGERIDKPQQVCGIKLERFIFDVFEFTQQFTAWQVIREDEFSPLKNADGTERDNPTTARKALLRANELGLLDL